MPAPNSVAELIDLVRKSNLVEPARLDGYLTTHPGPFETPAALCKKLRADGLITQFHAEQLVRGKYRGFFLGKYKVLDRIGLGGMGQVFLAEHTTMKRRAALKVLPPDRAENQFARERFMREARASGSLDHPNLVRAFDVDQDGEVIFLVMEFVDGVSFHDLVSRFGPLPPARAGYYLWQAALGLGYMAGRGMVHRDIKPANLLVDRAGVVKILDLGLVRAQVEQEELTRAEGVKILGTADYLSPEQAIDCSSVDIRADIYSLGATGYFLLTGRPPFDGDKIAQKLIAHQVTAVRPVHQARPDVPRELSDVIARMLAKKAKDRFQTPDEVAAALAGWAESPPPPPTEQEIPGAAGGDYANSSSVNLNLTPRPGTADSSATAGSSGSAIKYLPDAPPKFAPFSGRAGRDPSPIVLTPVPRRPAGRPAGREKIQPALLPASATHGGAGRPAATPATPARPLFEWSPDAVDNRPAPAAAPAAGPPSPLRHRVSMGLAFCLTLTLAAWNVAKLVGAGPRATKPPAAAPARPGDDQRDGTSGRLAQTRPD